MGDASGLWFIDGIDTWLNFGLLIKKGSADFLKIPDWKPSIEHDWQDVDGVSVDLSRIFFQPNIGTLECCMIAETEADYLRKHDAFIAVLKQPELRRLTITAFGNRSYYVHYMRSTPPVQLASMKGVPNNRVIHSFSLTLREPMPQAGTVDTYLSADNGAFLII